MLKFQENINIEIILVICKIDLALDIIFVIFKAVAFREKLLVTTFNQGVYSVPNNF